MKKQVFLDLDKYSEDAEYEWEDFIDERVCKTSYVVATGCFMAWCGKQEGGRVFNTLKDAIKKLSMEDDSHPIYGINDKGNLYISETHHDAPVSGNYYEIRILTDKGIKWYEKHIDEDRRFVCETLFNTKGLSRRVSEKEIA